MTAGCAMSAAIALVIPGAPRTKKTHNRVVRAGGRARVLPSEAWERWARTAAVTVRADAARRHGPGWWLRTFPLAGDEYNVAALFYRDALRGDAVGYYQGLADALELAGIVANDRVLVSWDGSRLLLDRADPRVELTITGAI
jgi:hypothetical protein